MPLSSKGEEIMGNMKKEYGSEKGEQVFYASKNKGTISGVDCSKLDAICDSMARLGERVDAYGKRRADAGPREENFQRANKASENREKEERDKKLEQLGRAFGRSRGDEEEARDDAYDSVDGGSMELLSKMRTDAARADFDPFTITMATIAGWSLYEIVQNIRQFRSLGKHNKEMQDLIDRLETEKKKRETRGDDHRVIGGVKLGDDDPLAALKKEIASEKDPKRQSELKKQLDKRQRDLDIAQMKRESRNGRGAG